MKKCISVLVLLAMVSAGAFALDMSIGGGLLFDYSMGNGLEASSSGYEYEEGMDITHIGGFFFFDATYVEANVYFGIGMSKQWVEESLGGLSFSDSGDGPDLMSLGFNLLGKFPIGLGNITLFPMAGIGYNMVVSAEFMGYSADEPGKLSQFGIMFGVGADFNITDSLFIRATGLFTLRFPDEINSEIADAFSDTDATFGMGPTIKVALGYRL